MSWGRIDDRMPEHRKWAAIEEAHGARVWADAMALWLCVLCHANRNETDGEIPRVTLSRLTPIDPKSAIRAADAMCEVGLMSKIDNGYRLHDFTSYNPSRAEKESARAAEAERGRQRRANGVQRASTMDAERTSSERPPWTPNGLTAESTLSRSRPDPVPIPDGDPDPERGGDLPAGVAPARGANPTTPRVIERVGIAGIAEQVWAQRLGARGGSHVMRAGDGPHFVAVAEAANRLRGETPLRVQLERWFDEWVATRRSTRLRAEWWAEWAAERAAQGRSGGFFNPSPSDRHEATTNEELELALGTVTDEDLKRVDRGRGARG